MQLAALWVFVIPLFNSHFWECSCKASEFNLDGDYLIGGLFHVHYTRDQAQTRRPEAVKCLEKPLLLWGYHGLQVMRFAVEEINNSSTLLPNVTLGYQLFDHCSDGRNFPATLEVLSVNGSVKPKQMHNHYRPEVISFIGAFSSTETLNLAPVLMVDLLPMVSYGASSSVLSDKEVYPSFIRTTPSNKNQIELIIHIIKHFGWNWVAFIGSKSDYSENGLKLFLELIPKTGICLGYQELLADTLQLNTVFHLIHMLNINVIILFTEQPLAEVVITSSIRLNFHNNVWIASDSWSMNQMLPKLQGIKTVGTIIGVTPTVVTLPDFDEFIYQSQNRNDSTDAAEGYCNQVCNGCSSVSPEDVISENPTFSFPIYSAVYTIATALHNALQCNQSGCNTSHTVYPYMLLQEIKRLQFYLNQFFISFDKNLDPPARYSVVFWDTSHQPAKIWPVGSYSNYPVGNLTINSTRLHWHGNGRVPFSNCSVECEPGYVRQHDGDHKCCFTCVQCSTNQYANYTADLYSCLECHKDEWSEAGSTACQKRSVEYLHFSDGYSVVLMIFASSFVLLCLGLTVLFAVHLSTPVVRSAGGSMCFLMLGCLATAVVSIFFYFGEPSAVSCALRSPLYIYFYTVCLSCLFVRSFQIICIFKMAAHLPKAHAWWVKHSGQWLVVAAISLLQFLLCAIWLATSPPVPVEDTSSFQHQIVLRCASSSMAPSWVCAGPLCVLSGLCFCFSYMGTDLPKNYNEAKAITFSMLLFGLSWATYFTASMVTQSKYIQLIQVLAQLTSLSGILLSYFIPKSFIIVFQPLKNTQEYVQASIQNYTQTISRM